MANKTSIEWTDYNWNFLRGCSRVSEGCRNCYAEGIAARFSGPGMAYEGLAKMLNHDARWTGEISFHEDILVQALRWKKPRRVFVNSMSDLFHEKVKDEWLDKAFAVMALTPQHTYQILTKRPERMLDYLKDRDSGYACGRVATQAINLRRDLRKLFPNDNEALGPLGFGEPGAEWWPLPNVWLGVSVEDQKTADERIPLLLQTPAAVRWISAEPLLGPVDFTHIQFPNEYGNMEDWNALDRCIMTNGVDDPTLLGVDDPILDWVVVGGESGAGARPFDIGWARSVIDQCRTAGVPVFVKQLGANVAGRDCEHGRDDKTCKFIDRKGGDMNEWPEDLRVREFPAA